MPTLDGPEAKRLGYCDEIAPARVRHEQAAQVRRRDLQLGHRAPARTARNGKKAPRQERSGQISEPAFACIMIRRLSSAILGETLIGCDPLWSDALSTAAMFCA
jgi:hypothetical protein